MGRKPYQPSGRRKPSPPPPHSNSGKGACSLWVPVAVAALPWAMFKMWRDSRRG